MGGDRDTPTRGQGSRARGVVAGYVLKIGRHATGATQERLAEALGVDTSTVQGWESGRRAVASMTTSEFFRLADHLARTGAPPSIGRDLRDAVHADIVLSTGTGTDAARADLDRHPLAARVLRRSTTNLLTWPFTGTPPPQLAAYPAALPMRGPTARLPVIDEPTRHQFFDHAIVVADRAAAPSLLRRQATYLLGFDTRTATSEWLRREQHAASTRCGTRTQSVSDYLASRSAALALGAAGDADHVHRLAHATGENDRTDRINLNYWAYWIGELADEEHNDAFLADDTADSWSGVRLFAHLTKRLNVHAPHRPLNLHTLHRLLAHRPEILERASKYHDSFADTLAQLESSPDISRRERDQVAGLDYAMRVARH